LTRTTRSQTLTEVGRSYYEHSLRLLDDLSEVESSLRGDHSSLKGRIKITVPLGFGLKHIAPALRQFNKINPEIIFEVDFSDRRIDLVEEGFDLAVRISKLEDSTLVARHLTSSNLIMCASSSYLDKYGEPQNPNDLKSGHLKLHYIDQPETIVFSDGATGTTAVKMPAVLISNNASFLCRTAIEGVGIIYMPDFICGSAIAAGKLKPILTDYMHENVLNSYIIYPQTRHISQRVRSLIDYLIEYVKTK